VTAYYNEHDAFAAAWLRELIKANLIAPGDVDERSIEDVVPSELMGYTQCHFFAGIGGWSYALRLSGWSDDRHIWTGSCPCQPFSTAGKGCGTADERHLWPALWWLVRQCSPNIILGEQVASKLGREWFEIVASDLEELGYIVGQAITTAAGAGAKSVRRRLYFVADGYCTRRQDAERWKGQAKPARREVVASHIAIKGIPKRVLEPQEGWVVNGVSKNVGAVRGFGNAIHPKQAEAFIRAVMFTNSKRNLTLGVVQC
jgi:DNA (cytosine-5)-methyltransferase 1